MVMMVIYKPLVILMGGLFMGTKVHLVGKLRNSIYPIIVEKIFVLNLIFVVMVLN